MQHRKTTIAEMNRLSREEFLAAEKVRLTVVLDNVRSMHNVGAVFRTADAFRLEGVILCGITARPDDNNRWADEVHKTALGAEDTVPWRYFSNTMEAVGALRKEGYTVFAVEQAHSSTLLGDVTLPPDGRYAIVLGHEVFGVQQEVVDVCDGCLEIPQYGTKHSLNVSVTAGIVIYELAMQLLGTKIVCKDGDSAL